MTYVVAFLVEGWETNGDAVGFSLVDTSFSSALLAMELHVVQLVVMKTISALSSLSYQVLLIRSVPWGFWNCT